MIDVAECPEKCSHVAQEYGLIDDITPTKACGDQL